MIEPSRLPHHDDPVGSKHAGKTIVFLLTAKRDKNATMRFFEEAVQANGIPEKVTMDKAGAKSSAIDRVIGNNAIAVEVRQIKYLNNVVEQGHRAVKRSTQPMLGFKSFRAATCMLADIELMPMIHQGQMAMLRCEGRSFADSFYALAELEGQVRPGQGLRHVRRSELALSKLMRQNPRYRPFRSGGKMQKHNLSRPLYQGSHPTSGICELVSKFLALWFHPMY